MLSSSLVEILKVFPYGILLPVMDIITWPFIFPLKLQSL